MSRSGTAALPARLWRAMPLGLRRSARDLAFRLLVPAAQGAPPCTGAITLAGLLRSPTGIGQGARLACSALAAAGRPVEAVDLTAAFHPPDAAIALPSVGPVAAAAGPVLIHLNAPYMPHALMMLGRRRVRGRRIIGYWAWELPALPPAWLKGLAYVHEVWTPSRFSAAAIAAAASVPVRVVPHPVPLPRKVPGGRARFGLPAGAFIVFAGFHGASGFARKNPLAAVAAFRAAFGERPDVLLVVKAGGGPAAEPLRRAVAGLGNIHLVEGDVPAAELAALLACCDALLSLHRAEGFGLMLAEAMRLGKPVVATGWSGNLDFMTADSAALVGYRLVPVADPEGIYDQPGQSWAEPDIAEAAAWLVRLAADPDLRAGLGQAARARAELSFGPDAFRRAIAAALGE